MNWLVRFAQQGMPLSINAMEEFVKNLGDGGYLDIPGQGYLWQGDEWNRLQQTRRLGQDDFSLMIKYFHMLFEAVADELRVDSTEVYSYNDQKRVRISMPEVNIESDPEMLQNQMEETAQALTESWEWGSRNQDEWISFLKHLGSETGGGTEYVELFDNAFNSTKLPSPEDFQKILSMVQAYEAQFDAEGVPHQFSAAQLQTAYANDARDPMTDPNEYNEILARITEEITYELIDNNDRYSREQKDLVPLEALEAMGFSWNNQKEMDYLPAWIKEDRLQEVAQDTLDGSSELVEWYMEEQKEMLERDADESVYQYNQEGMQEKAQEMIKNYGYDMFSLLAEDYDPADPTDERRDLELDDVWSMLTEMDDEMGAMADSVRDAVAWAAMYVASIKSAASRNSHLLEMFSQQLSNINVDQERLFRGIADAIKTSPQSIPDEFDDPEIQRIIQYLKRRKEEKGIAQELEESQGGMTPEQAQRLQELGISEQPFGHQYRLRQQGYPEMGYRQPVPSVLKPFEIAVGADESAGLPAEMLEQISPWQKSEQPDIPSIGYIGGFSDPSNNVMYITKVKSQLMERTQDMQTEESLKAQWERMAQEAQQKLDQLPNMALSPQQMEQEKEKLEEDLRHAQWKITNVSWPGPSLSKWHEFKSQVEETFKDWVPVFFNIAIREAVFWTFSKVRIISAEAILNSMYPYDRDRASNGLFEQLYDQTAQRYGATPVEAFKQKFWEIDLTNENLRYASRKQHGQLVQKSV